MKRTVLIVDDSGINRHMLKKILSDEYNVLEAENGKKGLALLRENSKTLSAVLLDLAMPVLGGYEVLKIVAQEPELSRIPIVVTTGSTDTESEVLALSLGAQDFVGKPYNAEIIKQRLSNIIKLRETAAAVNALRRDKLTGLFSREFFFEQASELIELHEAGYYALACMDIDNFKVINDQYGSEKGDEVLLCFARTLLNDAENLGMICGRFSADHFAVLFPKEYIGTDFICKDRYEAKLRDGSSIFVTVSTGRYIVEDKSLSLTAMYDRATIAQTTVKGRYDTHIADYDESMLKSLLKRQEIINEMKQALEEKQFEVWYQPQYNHSNGALTGAEALVRWRHPEKGIVRPDEFIPVFEHNGFIYDLDKYVWEETCKELSKWLSAGKKPLPVSVNISRYDIFREDLVDFLKELINRYELPCEILRLEITESAFAESSRRIIKIVSELIDIGFTVEIDDFGSGYSSLNTLKDVPAQVVKLDMRFLETNAEKTSERGGNIIESVVRMIKWLGLSIIAEGVETIEQADYLKSIGCSIIQGYLYSRPLPLEQYEELLDSPNKDSKLPGLETVEKLNNNAFWQPESMDSLIFNSYVGAATIFEYHDGEIELLRSTQKFAEMIGGPDFTVEETLRLDLKKYLSGEGLEAVSRIIGLSAATSDEVSGEFVFSNVQGNSEKIYLLSHMRVIAKTSDRCLVYCLNDDITAQRNAEQANISTAEQISAIMHNINGGISAVKMSEEGKPEYIFANDRYFSIYGYTREQFLKNKVYPLDRIVPEDRPSVNEAFESVKNGAADISYRCHIMKPDGEIAVIRVNSSIISLPGVDTPVSLSITSDITEAAGYEEKLREANRTLRGMMNDVPGGFAMMKVLPDGSLTTEYVNENLCRFRNLTFSQIVSERHNDSLQAIHPDDLPAIREILSGELFDGKCVTIQFRIKSAYGEYVPFNAFARFSKKSSGEVFINVYFAELTPAESKDFSFTQTVPFVLSAIMKFSSNLAFAKDRAGRYLCCTPAFAKSAGRQAESDIVGKTDFELFDAENAEYYRLLDEQLMETGVPMIDCVEALPDSGDGIRRYTSISKFPLRDTSGDVIGMYCIGHEITSEKNAEDRLRLLSENINGGIATYVYSEKGLRLTYFSDGFCRLSGYSREEYTKIAEGNPFPITYIDDIPLLLKQIYFASKNGAPLHCKFRIYHKDGSIRWVTLRGNLTDRRGDECYFTTVFYDADTL